jgi:hypothetical protein
MLTFGQALAFAASTYHDDLELANDVFLKTQTLDPDHTMAWVS